MVGTEPFTLVDKLEQPRFFDDYQYRTSAKDGNLNVQLIARLRNEFPEMTITPVYTFSCNLLRFAAAGYAEAVLDLESDDAIRQKYYLPPIHRGAVGGLADGYTFAKYRYTWGDEYFIIFIVSLGFATTQYILKEPRSGETTTSDSATVNSLLMAIGEWEINAEGIIYVYDSYWARSRKLWDQVEESSWDKVILEPAMKKELTDVAGNFFDRKSLYDDLKVPWKRGLIFYGPAGNGKTISVKALMHTLYHRKNPIPSLYVKNAPYTYDIREIFQFARQQSPCMLVLEDIDTIVNGSNRSYFLNELDGLEKNDGILLVATTNHLDRLDAGLSKRPSRFDRKYVFNLPSETERVLYCEYWKRKMSDNPIVEFPIKLCKPIAEITSGFSFAYMQELFVASLLDIAHREDEDSYPDQKTAQMTRASDGNLDSLREDLDRYKLWRAIKRTVKILRHEIEDPDNPSNPGKDLLGSSSDCHTEAIPNANANTDALPILLAAKQNCPGKAGLVVDEQIERMLSGQWQKENRSHLSTYLPPRSRPHAGSRPYPQACDAAISLASSRIPDIAEANKQVMMARDEEDLCMLFPFGPRRDGGRVPRQCRCSDDGERQVVEGMGS